MKKLNNKGYMLIEIILAIGLAMGIGYFLIELTLKVKNTNDDLLVESLVKTDQGIIYNMIMDNIYEHVRDNKSILQSTVFDDITTKGNKVIYKYTNIENEVVEKAIIVTDYAIVGAKKTEGNKITIPISVKQLADENFDVVIYFVN